MQLPRWLTRTLLAATLALVPLASHAGIFISVGLPPPPLPYYDQPPCPDDGNLWTPGYWAYGEYGYYWVPGCWVQPPEIGFLWTPGYWGWNGGNYRFNNGYWGPQVGFYGGVDYGFGYGGNGYGGGRWNGGHFQYNRVVNNVNVTNIHNTYVDNSVSTTRGRNVSFNGGNGGINAQPNAEQMKIAHENHVGATSLQRAHITAASHDKSQFAKFNGGKPTTLATTKPGAFNKEQAVNKTMTTGESTDKVAPKEKVRKEKKTSSFSGGQNNPEGNPGENHTVHTESVDKPHHTAMGGNGGAFHPQGQGGQGQHQGGGQGQGQHQGGGQGHPQGGGQGKGDGKDKKDH